MLERPGQQRPSSLLVLASEMPLLQVNPGAVLSQQPSTRVSKRSQTFVVPFVERLDRRRMPGQSHPSREKSRIKYWMRHTKGSQFPVMGGGLHRSSHCGKLEHRIQAAAREALVELRACS